MGNSNCEPCSGFIIERSTGNECVDHCPAYWPYVKRGKANVCIAQCQGEECKCPELQYYDTEKKMCVCTNVGDLTIKMEVDVYTGQCVCPAEAVMLERKNCVTVESCRSKGMVVKDEQCVKRSECAAVNYALSVCVEKTDCKTTYEVTIPESEAGAYCACNGYVYENSCYSVCPDSLPYVTRHGGKRKECVDVS